METLGIRRYMNRVISAKSLKNVTFIVILLIVFLLAFSSCTAKEHPDAGKNMVKDGNEAFMIDKGSEKAVLLLHGFTASPWEVRELGEFLAENGFTVYAPLIAGHGTSPENLAETSWQDWYRSAEQGYAMLKGKADCVYVGGVSTGGSLALLLAAEHDTCGVISISSTVYLQDWKANFAVIAKYFIPYTTRPLNDEDAKYYYEERPTAGVAQLMNLISETKKRIGDIKEKVLILQAKGDRTVNPASADYIFENIGSEKKEKVIFENGQHVMIRDENLKEEAFAIILGFVE